MRRALVTGAAGFVGQRMIPALDDAGYTIRSVDINDPVQPVDARDFFRRSTERFDLVVHLAAVVGGRATIEGDALAVAVDLAIDAEMWQWAARTGQPHVLYFSSSAAYPVNLQRNDRGFESYILAEDDIDLDNIESPDLSYGLAKLVGEYQAREARKHGVKVTIARPFSGTGPTQSLDYPVPAIIERALHYQSPIEIWSDSVRDVIHIDDVIKISLAAVEQGIEEPFNCGTGLPMSFTALTRMIAATVGYQPEIKVLSDKPAGVAYRVADIGFMRSFYKDPLIPIESIVAEMVRCRREFLEPRCYPALTLGKPEKIR